MSSLSLLDSFFFQNVFVRALVRVNYLKTVEKDQAGQDTQVKDDHLPTKGVAYELLERCFNDRQVEASLQVLLGCVYGRSGRGLWRCLRLHLRCLIEKEGV